MSPEGTPGNSQGRKPLETGKFAQSPGGTTEWGGSFLSPLRGSSEARADSQGLAPLAIGCRRERG